uniref:Uncharacterized protein n=1 Tax=Gossypium raimondii TaxID=29730 RepID=A0A0D2SLR5_GOSRA|nr:hypothetical protein B456_007G293400 [Gossypium raimondii]
MTTSKGALPHYAPKALPGSANQSNLLPTDTVFAFQAIIPSFSNNGKCETTHKYITLGVIVLFSLACFFSSFTDSFVRKDGKLYYEAEKMLKKYRLTAIDFMHACCSLTLFLVLACSSFNRIRYADKPDHGNRNEEKQTQEIANKEPLPNPK